MQAVFAPADTRVSGWMSRVWAAMGRPAVLCVIPVVYFVLLLVGVVRAYTPVPTHDMWEGALLSYLRALENGFLWETLSFWNEHRIVLSKLLFWIDFEYFDARFAFLIAANVVLLLSIWIALCALGRRLIARRGDWLAVCAGLSAISLSWLQRENLDSPFQSQFLLAYLVPLLAFCALARAMRDAGGWRWFAAALVLGAASLGTMANGLLVFPLLFAMQAARWSWHRIGLIVACGAVLTAMWFRSYSGAAAAPPMPRDFFSFVATFIAFPFADLTGSIAGGVIGAALYISGLAYALYRCWKVRARMEIDVFALLALIAFVLATAILTAYGRAAELANAALVSRYATPSLVAWAALALLLAAVSQDRVHAGRLFVRMSFAVALFLLPIQLIRPLGDDGPALVQGSFRAALAFELDIPDPKATAWVFHVRSSEQYEVLRDVAAQLSSTHRSIFADPMWGDAIGRLGGPAGTGYRACENAVEGVSIVPGDVRYRAVRGWAVDLRSWRQPRFVYFAADGKIVGLAVRGAPRYDVIDIFYPRNGYRGFDGYVLASSATRFEVLCPE
ncbi:MAG: hypothetical protein LCH56_02705 [Proteobacteria bacterium]|nr:hypothetical protein [Pseudomonadota bacterium]